MQSLFSVVALTIAIGSVIFAAVQTRILARQAKMLQTTTELSYNLEVIGRMNELLLQIAEHRKSRAYVWGKVGKQNDRTCHQRRAFLDLLDAAVHGVDQLSKFEESKFENWTGYVEYVLEHSQNLRDEVLSHPGWWPAIAPIVDRLTD